METDQADADLLLLSLSLSDSEPEEAATPSNTTTAASSTAPTTEHQPTRAERTALSEEAFQALKQTYRPKIENGNIYKTISPLQDSPTPTPLSKPEAQALLHAVEELYFFRQYARAAGFVRHVLSGDGDGDGAGEGRGLGRSSVSRGLDDETWRLFRYYLDRCLSRLKEGDGVGGK